MGEQVNAQTRQRQATRRRRDRAQTITRREQAAIRAAEQRAAEQRFAVLLTSREQVTA